MKKIIVLTVLLTFSLSVFSQEIIKVPEITIGEKHSQMVFMFWANLAPGVKFAKEHNVSPYDYGAYYGKLFASNRNIEAGFKGYARTVLHNWELFVRESDKEIEIESESDSLLVLKVPSNILLDLFGDEGFVGVTAQEMLEMFNGSHAQISGAYGCTSKMILDGQWIVVTVKKNE
jgi:hypothetical protein